MQKRNSLEKLFRPAIDNAIAKIIYVLDEFHLEKAITKLTSHMKDSREDARKELYEAIRRKKREDFEEVIDRLEGC